MNDRELDELLKSAQIPGRADEYWHDFPQRISAKLHWQQRSSELSRATPSRKMTLAVAWGLALAAVLLVFGLVARFQSRPAARALATNSQLTEARKCYHELEALFPNQIQSIVFDEQGPRLVLADRPNVPDSTPFYLRICGPGGCEGFVTFSGQRISFNGENCEVLADARGEVLLVGSHQVWSQSDQSETIRIQAIALTHASKEKSKAKI